MAGDGNAGDRRSSSDRREGSAESGRRGTRGGTSALTHVLRALGAIIVLLGVIIYTVRVTRPVYATRGTLGDELRRRAPEVAAVIAPADSTAIDQFMATSKFQKEKQNFYADVMRLKQVDSARADSIAHFAVREAYRRGISPALIFGVMLTENSRFISNATSNVGAVGLMQVYPKVWLTKEMTKLFGRDLATDSTNVKYGVFILNQYFKPKDRKGQVRERDWATALLRYNGCVRGTNTPRCHTYPSKVKGFIENQGTSICSGRGFYDCIAKPFIEGLIGVEKDSSASASAAPGGLAPQAAAVVPTAAAPTAPAPAVSAPLPAAAPSNTTPAKVAPVNVAPANVAPANVAPANVAPAKVAPGKVAPANVAPANVAPVKMAPARVAPAKASSGKVASAARMGTASRGASAKDRKPVRTKSKSARPATRSSRPRDEIPPPPKPIILKVP